MPSMVGTSSAIVQSLLRNTSSSSSALASPHDRSDHNRQTCITQQANGITERLDNFVERDNYSCDITRAEVWRALVQPLLQNPSLSSSSLTSITTIIMTFLIVTVTIVRMMTVLIITINPIILQSHHPTCPAPSSRPETHSKT